MKSLFKNGMAILLVSMITIGAASAGWQCNVRNAKNQKWVGTGPTRAVAAANAIGFCSAHSRYTRNCDIITCFIR